MTSIDLSSPRRVHLVGIGGAGMSAIASVLVTMGHRVTGSDLKAAGTERLRALGVGIEVGHADVNVPAGADAVAVSTAIPPDNPEVLAAIDAGIPVLRRAEILRAICSTRRTIAVAGTHGKTTTSSMLALVLIEADLHPSFIIGGNVNEIGTGAAWDDGEWLVVEADESDGTFLELGAEVAIVTSVEADHLDHYATRAAIDEAFSTFLAQTPGAKVVCADDPGAAHHGRAHDALLYGTAPTAKMRIVDPVESRSSVSFDVVQAGELLGRVQLPVPGMHNARNATAALATAMAIGVPFDAGARALGRYAGVARRFQFRGARDGVTFVDDYAHNPGKVRAVLAAARAGGWTRIVAVFQPHLYSRTQLLAEEFGEAFVDADLVVVTDVYGAREQPLPGVTGKLIVDAILEHHPGARVAWFPGRADLARHVRGLLRPGDLCLTLSAGDLTLLPDELLGTDGR